MSLTITEARDEMLTLVRTAFEAAKPSGSPELLYRDLHGSPPESGTWGRVRVQHVTGGQGSLANHSGVRRYERTGFVILELYSDAGDGMTILDNLSKAMLDAFEGATTAGGVWFRNVRLNELNPDGRWQRVQVFADFTYDEIK